MDLRQPTRIGEHIDDDFDELVMGKGYDHNWVIRDEKPVVEMKPGMFGFDPSCPIDYVGGGLKKAAYAESDQSGFTLTCLETQYFPNAFANPNFPQPILKKGDTWKAQTVYVLGQKD